jgi:hypothetical protein
MTWAVDPVDAVAPSPVACPFDPELPADECCGTRGTDCCDGPKPDCATAIGYDSNGDPDVVVCATGHGCNVYGDNVVPEDERQATRDAWTRLDEAEVVDGLG